jgi:signal recognition particle receptor subunit beta
VGVQANEPNSVPPCHAFALSECPSCVWRSVSRVLRTVSLVNYATREITCKIVYYGPGRSGKTTNLHYIYGQVPEERKGKMVSLATQTDRTLFFDFLPLDLGLISGFTTKFQLYTVPGQVYYQTTRKLVLQGADGVVFVADSQARQLAENVESLQDLHANLAEQGVEARSVPLVIQYNKQDLPPDLILSAPELSDALNFRGVPDFAADALHGPGVFETLRSISELVLKRLSGGTGAVR